MPAAGIDVSRARGPCLSDENAASPAACAAFASSKQGFSRWSQSGTTWPWGRPSLQCQQWRPL